MEGITGGLRSKWRDIVGKERHWGRSFLKRFNVTSCARVDSCGRSAMATTSKTREHKIEHKSDHDNASHDDVVVGETKVEDKEVHVVTEQQHVLTKAEDVDVVAVDKTNGVDQAPMSHEIEDVEEDGKELDTVKKMLKKMDKTKVKDVEEDGKDQAPITTVEVVTTIDEEGPMGAGEALAADVGDVVVLDEAFATGGQELDTSEASAAAATIGEEVIGGSSVSDEEEVNRREMAATTIQIAFRGHLARRAFRALRGLVKLQALARGSYVRRQAQVATTCMQALVRLQVRVRDRQQQRRRLPRTKAGDP